MILRYYGIMFELTVTNLHEAEYIIDSGWATRIISVLMQDVPLAGSHHLHLKFDDVETLVPVFSGEDCILPQKQHLLQLLKFTEDLSDDDKVLVHCLQGKSRSTAAAIAILIQHGMSHEDAYLQIASIRPKLSPNKLLIQFIDDHFGLGGKLTRFVAERELFPSLFKMAKEG